MKVCDVINLIEEKIPLSSQCSWDNSGFLAGDRQSEVSKVMVALDATDEIIDIAVAEGVDMLVTHHPLIFSARKSITTDDFIGKRLVKLIKNGINYYATHTSYDVSVMGNLAGEKLGLCNVQVLEVTGENSDGQPEGIGVVGESANGKPLALRELCEEVKSAYNVSQVKVFAKEQENRTFTRIAICPGSGKSVIDEAIECKAEVLVTGDIDHHSGIDAVAQGLTIIDAGHYGVEQIFIEEMYNYLSSHLIGLSVIMEVQKEPFVYM